MKTETTPDFFSIGHFKLGPNEPCFVIAEIGNNHNGSLERAKQLVDVAVEAGANCAKFQMRNLSAVYRKKSMDRTDDDLSTEYTIDLLKRFELSSDDQRKVSDYCKQKGILYMCTPWDADSVATLEKMGVAAYKVASADLTNIPLIEVLCKTGKPLILSSGMSSSGEIQKTIDFLNSKNAKFAILHCNSTYPAPFQHINLKFMDSLRKMHPIVGYSGHERGTAVSIGAVALGAKVIERHLTLDRGMEGPDHSASLEPKDFKTLMEGIRQVEMALGDGGERKISQGEMMNRENLAKSLVSARAMKKGTVLRREDIDIRSPGRGLSPQFLSQLVGTELKRDVESEEYFYPTDLQGGAVSAAQYKFRRPWGIPVRYYDFDEFYGQVKPDLVEFHLSYGDMVKNPGDYLKGTYDIDFVVHAPELFDNSMLMDLATPDEAYRKKSLADTQRVIDITRELKKFFPKTKRPMIVANIGGFSMDAEFPTSEVDAYYARFAKSLKELNMDGVELIPQTMAPFPWHFGGQRFQNLFVRPDQIVKVCKQLGLRICFDVSHTKLMATHFKLDFNDVLRELAPVTAHLHIADAKGVDGEGLQVGDGEIDFTMMAKILDERAPKASFIPEIWQGHKNGGEGFWIALDRLQKSF
jgi:sialic acid synthase SpsE/sugar phosphate isomerase/epimerase